MTVKNAKLNKLKSYCGKVHLKVLRLKYRLEKWVLF